MAYKWDFFKAKLAVAHTVNTCQRENMQVFSLQIFCNEKWLLTELGQKRLKRPQRFQLVVSVYANT